MFDFSVFSSDLIVNYSYFGLFIISLITSLIMFMPIPIFPFLVLAALFLNPWLAALIVAIGSSIGEIAGYFTGMGTSHIFKLKDKVKNNKMLLKVKNLLEKKHFYMVALLSLIPLPMNTLGIAAGIIRYKKLKFIIGVFIGKLIRMFVYTAVVLLGIKIFT